MACGSGTSARPGSPEAPGPLTSVRLAFHPDGRRLAISGAIGHETDYSLRDPRCGSKRRSCDRDEARSRVAFLYERLKTADEVRERLRVDPCISEDVRGTALACVTRTERTWPGATPRT